MERKWTLFVIAGARKHSRRKNLLLTFTPSVCWRIYNSCNWIKNYFHLGQTKEMNISAVIFGCFSRQGNYICCQWICFSLKAQFLIRNEKRTLTSQRKEGLNAYLIKWLHTLAIIACVEIRCVWNIHDEMQKHYHTLTFWSSLKMGFFLWKMSLRYLLFFLLSI